MPPDESEDSHVIAFISKIDASRPLPKFVREKRRSLENPTVCEHRDLVVDKAERTVECGECGAVLDPFECLFRIDHYYQQSEWKVELIRQREAKEREMRRIAVEQREKKRLVLTPP